MQLSNPHFRGSSIAQRLYLLLFFLCLLQPLGAATLQEFLGKLNFTAIPLKRQGFNRLLAEAKINGKYRPFLVDSGATFSMVPQEWTYDTVAVSKMTNFVSGALGGSREEVALVTIPKLEFKTCSVENVKATVMALGKSEIHVGSNIPKAAASSGSLGADFMIGHSALLDVGGMNLYIREAPLDEERKEVLQKTLSLSGYQKIPGSRNNALLLVTPTIDGKATRFLIDTGSSFTTIGFRSADALNITSREVVARSRDIKGRTTDSAFGKVSSFDFGNFKTKEQIVCLENLSYLQTLFAGDHIELTGLLGIDILFRYGAIIDYGANAIHLLNAPDAK